MTGQYGHRGGRGGRGGCGGRTPTITSTKEAKKKKTIEDYFFYVGSSKQASDFETTSELLINYVKKTFDRGNDVAEALRTLTPENTELWKPTLQFSIAADDVVSKQEKVNTSSNTRQTLTSS
jgi:superfamily II DNA/RNA helicase